MPLFSADFSISVIAEVAVGERLMLALSDRYVLKYGNLTS